jgi:hypothetical protein
MAERLTTIDTSLATGDLVEIRVPASGSHSLIHGRVLGTSKDGVILQGSVTQKIRWIPAADLLQINATGRASLPDTLVRTYRGSPAEATAKLQDEAPLLARAGFKPTTQVWAAGQWGTGAFLVALVLTIFIVGILALVYMLIVKPEGALTVTFAKGEDAVAEDTMSCPRCAETIKAAALACRFCGLDLGSSRISA